MSRGVCARCRATPVPFPRRDPGIRRDDEQGLKISTPFSPPGFTRGARWPKLPPMLTKAHVCGVSHSILGQPWRWRGTAGDDGIDASFQPDDLIDQLLMARGV